MKIYIVLAILIFSNIQNSFQDSVCSLHTLKKELLEDIQDNGALDCLRVIPVPHNKKETEAEKNLRILAQWDSSCSFEGKNNMFTTLKEVFGITELVDVNGDVVMNDFEDQADMCELVRAATSKGLLGIKDIDMKKLPKELVNKIDCPGAEKDNNRAKICAASSESFYKKSAWTVFLRYSVIKFAGKPNFARKIELNQDASNFYDSISNNELINNLLNYSKDFLDKQGGKIAKAIDQTFKPDGKSNNDNKNQNSNGNAGVKTFANSGNVDVKEGNKFQPVSVTGSKFPVDFPLTLFSFYMTSFNLDKNEVLKLRSYFEGKEIKESRTISGHRAKNSVTGAFTTNLIPNKQISDVSVHYTSSNDGQIKSDGQTSNFIIGTILLKSTSIKVYNNQERIILKPNPSSNLIQIPDVVLNLSNDQKQEVNYLVFYNIALNTKSSEESLGIVLKQSVKDSAPKDIKETLSIVGKQRFISAHGATIITVQPEEKNKLVLGYTYSGSNEVNIDNDADENTGLSLSAIELSNKNKIHRFKLTKNVFLTTSTYKQMGFNAALKLKKNSKLLILFHFNIKIENKDITMRLRLNKSYSKRSIMSFGESDYASGQGYVIQEVNKGDYLFDIEFISTATGTIVVENGEDIHSQSVSLTIVELEE